MCNSGSFIAVCSTMHRIECEMESRRVRDEPASSTCTEISKLGLDMPASERWRARRRCEEGGDDGGTGERDRGHRREGAPARGGTGERERGHRREGEVAQIDPKP